MNSCSERSIDRRKVFWVTQPNACGENENDCGDLCGIAGLSFIKQGQFSTISNKNYVIGLVLNILLTDARKADNECGYTPGTRGGHWSDSYTGAKTGSKIRQIPTNYSVKETIALIKAHIQQDCQKLVSPYGVAEKVEIEAEYAGSNTVNIVLNIFGRSGDTFKVGLKAVRLTNSWAWSTSNVM